MPGFYPEKPPAASNGKSFERLGVRLHRHFLREEIEVFEDKHRQWTIGESAQGVEFKELQKSIDRFHIEIAEKVNLTSQWRPSGIMRNDNTTRYVCGNDQDIFAFRKTDLRQWREINQPKEVWYGKGSLLTDADNPLATIRSFVLPKTEGWLFCLYRFQQHNGSWQYTVKDKNWMTAHQREALGPFAETAIGSAAINQLTSSSLPPGPAIAAQIRKLFGKLTIVEKNTVLADLQQLLSRATNRETLS